MIQWRGYQQSDIGKRARNAIDKIGRDTKEGRRQRGLLVLEAIKRVQARELAHPYRSMIAADRIRYRDYQWNCYADLMREKRERMVAAFGRELEMDGEMYPVRDMARLSVWEASEKYDFVPRADYSTGA